ncbi:NFACT family protein [Candidatus Acetothermia bacterium]|jgi:predicted ribosome quality control (RQC) complex YloA/Tae2 family protein|nr:NFACT family protein [Candidatus Acetothermia bacterium]MCI2428851.1 NFACT family protein [Candidatus Acetothermia bacterium]
MDGIAIAAAIREIRSAVIGGLIEQIAQTDADGFVLYIYAGSKQRLLLIPSRARIHLTQLSLPHPTAPSSFCMLLRKYVRYGRIIDVVQEGYERVVRLVITRKVEADIFTYQLVIELLGNSGNLILLRDGKIINALHDRLTSKRPIVPGKEYLPPPAQEKIEPHWLTGKEIEKILNSSDPVQRLAACVAGVDKRTAHYIITAGKGEGEATFAIFQRVLSHIDAPVPVYYPADRHASFFPLSEHEENKRGEEKVTFAAALDREYLAEVKRALEEDYNDKLASRFIAEINRYRRATERVEERVAEAKQADQLRRQADVIMANLHRLKRGSARAIIVDPYSGEAREIEIDPMIQPVDYAQRLYLRARKLQRGMVTAYARLDDLQQKIALLEGGLTTLRNGGWPSDEAVSLVEERRQRPQRKESRKEKETASREYNIDGFIVRIGKNAVQNDRLIRQAAPDDLWFHARGVPGSHVIINRGGKREVPDRVIEIAAQLAARHSQAQQRGKVEVSYTKVKYLRKPKGAPPGLVILTQEDTLIVELSDPARTS